MRLPAFRFALEPRYGAGRVVDLQRQLPAIYGPTVYMRGTAWPDWLSRERDNRRALLYAYHCLNQLLDPTYRISAEASANRRRLHRGLP